MSKKSEVLSDATARDTRWAAIVARNPEADGTFYYAVRTTGVYCRPACGARTAKPENVEFYMTTVDAVQAGYRPCKRCKPDQPSLAKRVRVELVRSDTVTEAIYEAGYNSNGRFYEKSNQVLGMTPTNFRAGGANTEIRFAIGECSLGSILVAASECGVCSILLGDDPDELLRDLQDRFPRASTKQVFRG